MERRNDIPQGWRKRRGAVAPGSAWALVTGAGSGIGRCYALRLAALGYRLVIVGNNPAPLEAVAKEIREKTGKTPRGKCTVGSVCTQTDIGETPADGKAGRGNAATGVAGWGKTDKERTSDCTSGRGNAATGVAEAKPDAAGTTADGIFGTETEGAGERACRIVDTGTSAGRPEAEGTDPSAGGTRKNGMQHVGESGVSETAGFPEVRVIPMDLARVGAAQELHARIAEEGIEIDVVINNAGIFSFCDILATPEERIERIIVLHDLTVTQLCRLYAADMVRRGVGGHILNMSSYSLWMPFPGLALYSASKAYMRAFSVAFAKEVREKGIRVTAVCPAGVATDLYGLTHRWQRIGSRLGVLISADSCARRGLRALWRGRRTIVPDWWNRAWIPLCKILPMWVLRPVRRFTMKFQK